jgi:hypothetical protein
MNPFKMRKYRRLFYRSFPSVFRPTKRTYSSPEPTEDEKKAGEILACVCFGIFFIFLWSSMIIR